MADKFPNLPGIPVDVQDGHLTPDKAAQAPRVMVIGTAGKGPSRVESVCISPTSAIRRFGLDGTLGRSISEVFQGGTDNAVGFRVLSTSGLIQHIGDKAGTAGITLESANLGSDALEKFSVLYDNADDILKVYDAVTSQLVFSNDPANPVDLGLVVVTGTQVANNSVGSIGLQVKVASDETTQVFNLVSGALTTIQMDASVVGLNLSLLQATATNTYKVQLKSGLADATRLTSHTVVACATAAALNAVTVTGGTGSVLTANADGILVIDGQSPADGARVLIKNQADTAQNGIYIVTDNGAVDDPFVLTRVADADADTPLAIGHYVNVTAGDDNEGLRFMVTAIEASPWTILSENAWAQVSTTAADHFVECVASAFVPADNDFTITPALTLLAFPEGLDHDIRFISEVKPVRADKILTNRLSLAATESLLVTPGSDFNGLPKITNDDGLTVDDALAECAPAKMCLYEAMEDAFLDLEASNFAVVVVPGVYQDDPALDGETSGVTALPAPIIDSAIDADTLAPIFDVVSITMAGFADRVTLQFDTEAERLLAIAALATAGRGACWISFSERQGTAFGDNIEVAELVRTARILNWESATTVTDLVVFFDRNVSFSLTSGVVVAANAPAFKIFETDLLFYHRATEVAGELVHQWYTAKTDLDGYEYHEVNFAFRLAKFCEDMTANQVACTGVIGVRPPTNHFSPASISTWIGKSPSYTEEGDVDVNGSGLLGFKFVSGKTMLGSVQFDPGFKSTEDGELDDTTLLLDGNEHEIDMGKYMSVVASWPILSNESDPRGLGYFASGAALYAGLLSALPSWSAATSKKIGGRGIRLAKKLAKRHQDSLVGARYVVLDQDETGVIVVDAPSAALLTSDFTRNMSVRLVGDVIRTARSIARPFLGEALSKLRKAGLETSLRKGLGDYQKLTAGALEGFDLTLTQTRADQVAGTARLALSLKVVNELRKIYVSVALAL